MIRQKAIRVREDSVPPFLRRKRLREEFQQDPISCEWRFRQLLETFQKTYEVWLSKEKIQKQTFKRLKKLAKDLQDYMELDILVCEKPVKAYLRDKIRRFV